MIVSHRAERRAKASAYSSVQEAARRTAANELRKQQWGSWANLANDILGFNRSSGAFGNVQDDDDVSAVTPILFRACLNRLCFVFTSLTTRSLSRQGERTVGRRKRARQGRRAGRPGRVPLERSLVVAAKREVWER